MGQKILRSPLAVLNSDERRDAARGAPKYAERGCAGKRHGEGSHGARPVHLIIAMTKWIRTSGL